MSSRDLSRTTKLIFYEMLILHVLIYGAKAWLLLSIDTEALGVFERKAIRKIFDPVRVANTYDVAQRIKKTAFII